MIRMKDDAHTPSGYCPHCGYRIDPGRCPECGAIISTKKLLRVAPRTRFRRRARTLVLVIVVALLVIGVNRLVATDAWRRYAPTPVLLALKNDASLSVFFELGRRYQAGKLTAAQVQRLFDEFLQPQPDFELIDPHPAYVPIRVKLDIAFDEPGFARQLTANAPPQIRIDAEQIDPVAAPMTNSSWASQIAARRIQKWGEFVVLPGLPPGQHKLVFAQDFLYLRGASPTMAVPLPWTLRVSQTITVVERSASAFATARSGDERGEIRGEIELQLDPLRAGWNTPFPRMIPLRFSDVSAPIVGTVEVRIDAEQEFRPIKRIVYDGTADYRETIDLSGTSGISAARRSDVRIAPGPPEFAIEYGMREYYGRIIEWPDVLLAIDIPVSEADEGLAKVVEFLERFGGPTGQDYRDGIYQFRFEGKLAVLPKELQQELQRQYPQFRFSVARMNFLGFHGGPINLIIVSEADSGEVRTHGPPLWLGDPTADFSSTFCGLSCRDVRAVERKAHALASILSFAMDGEVGTTAVNLPDRTVEVEIFWPHRSMDRPYRVLRFRFDERLRISHVEVFQPQ